jgi:hypothetical protein
LKRRQKSRRQCTLRQSKSPPARPRGPPGRWSNQLPSKANPTRSTTKWWKPQSKKGVVFLKGQFKDGELTPANNSPESNEGGDALAVYALLHASEAIDDSDLSSSSAFMSDILDHVKRYPMNTDKPIYGRAIRCAALSILDREQDREALAKDRQWLLKSVVNGAWGYEMPPAGVKPDQVSTDNSTSQFGVLGLWAAATAGQPVPDKLWSDVEKHWLSCQDDDGGWSYNTHISTSNMTAAGVTTLSVAAEYESADATSKSKMNDARPAFSVAVDKGLKYLSAGDNLINFNGHYGYGLYTVERMALATGLRWFGKHDWYRELGARAIAEQLPDGSWEANDYRDAGTSFTILFLARGRQPLLMDKLRFAGDWDDRPRDVAKLVQFASAQLERPFAWGVADLNRDWWDWLESPVLFISTDTPPAFSDEECGKLRSYAEGGGLIFLHNEFASKQVDAFATDLAHRLFPAYPLKDTAADDPLFNDVFQMKQRPAIKSVSNGTRTLLIYSPKDITEEWARYRPHDNKDNPAMQLGLNLFVDGAGKGDYRNRLNTPYVGPIDEKPLATVPVALISYPGPWNPEPGAWLRFPRWFQKQTSIAMQVQPTDIRALNFKAAPVAILTGNADVDFSRTDTAALENYVRRGGVLFIDSTGGNKAFATAVREVLLPAAFPGLRAGPMPVNHPILAGEGPCMDPLPKPHVRTYTASLLNGPAPMVQYANFGKGAVIISDLDVTTGLLDSGTYSLYGYTPAYCQSLLKNIVLWTMSRYAE